MYHMVDNTTDNNPVFIAARQLAACGLATIPIPFREKGPRLRNWPDHAGTTIETHRIWFPDGIETNVGLATGKKSGVFALDIDRKHDGLGSLADLVQAHGPLPTTAMQETPSGGKHYLFRLPDGVTIGNAQSIRPGIDIRGEGGVIVVAPSIHPNGGRYAWAERLAPWEVPVAEAPTWLIDLMRSRSRPEKPAQPTAKSTRIVVDPQRVREFKEDPASAEAVVAGCAAIRSLYEDPAGVSEWTWKQAGGVLGRCEDGRRLFHHASGLASTRYTPLDTDRALDYMLGKDGPPTCAGFAAEAPSSCAACPFRHSITTPLQLGRQSEKLVTLQAGHFYATDADAYWDIERQIVKKSKDFRNTYAHRFGNAHQEFVSSSTAPKVDQLAYLPGELSRITTTDRGVRVGNTWLNDGIPAVAGDWSIWEEHFDWLIPNDEGQRDHLLDVMAHAVQRPAGKIKHALLLVGTAQQTGKTSIAKALAAMLGPTNTVVVPNGELESDFQGGLYNKQLAVFEELFLPGIDRYNSLKETISENEARSQLKGIDFATKMTPRVILALSNKDLPIMIPEADDARWFVIRTPVQRRDEAYYSRLYGEGQGQLPAFKAALLARDLQRFNPNRPPPMNKAKAAMIAASRSPFAQALDLALEINGRQVVIPGELVITVRTQGVSASEPQVRDALRQRGGIPLGRMRQGSTWVSPWAVENVEHWQGAGAEAVRQELGRPA
ncbi:bifunctional DNA primase/polymerase [Methylorubrum thiocyanatum]|uniref:bifunctional DNA primase/polymerase n=1 Tax=Methylorubrum thiocyanatum TaxID=47958 RepID=UPI0035C87BD4